MIYNYFVKELLHTQLQALNERKRNTRQTIIQALYFSTIFTPSCKTNLKAEVTLETQRYINKHLDWKSIQMLANINVT